MIKLYSVFSWFGRVLTDYLLTPPVVYGAAVVAIIGIFGLCLLTLR